MIRKLFALLIPLFFLSGCAIITDYQGEGAGTVTQEGAGASSGVSSSMAQEDGVSFGFRTNGKAFEQYQGDKGWQQVFLAGVNIGAGKPGYFPGEMAVSKDDYLRWFEEITEMGADVVRVYTILPPDFYFALKQFNEGREKPLYFMQGVYNNEDDAVRLQDVFAEDGKMEKDWVRMCILIVDVVHGNADIERVPGNAGGIYSADVSPWLCGWIHGIEWSAEVVKGTNRANPSVSDYQGEYLHTENASPFEVFLAEGLDECIAYETKEYGMQHPCAFANWVTTDPLAHPGEPNREMEDAVSLDTEHIVAGPGFKAGLFASYHVYPYYPEMMRYAPELQKDGNPYKTYLELLNAYHTVPVIISEFGVPASRGITHLAYKDGFTQGGVTEKEQGRAIVSLLKDIVGTGCAGGYVFIWQDEWFERTWNTGDYTVADERAYWSDYQTSEQYFGLLSFDPGKEPVCVLDGKKEDWAGEAPVLSGEGAALYVKSDEKYLYLMLEGETDRIYLDTIPNQGAVKHGGADFCLELKGKEGSRLLIDPYYDVNYWLYTTGFDNVMEEVPGYALKGTGHFAPIYLMLNRKQLLSDGTLKEMEMAETGKLRHGNGDPAAADYDSLSDFCIGEVTELRLPWLLLNINAPNKKLRIADLYANEWITTEPIDGIGFIVGEERGEYSWEGWQMPAYRERLKQSYYILQDYLKEMDFGVR